MENRVMENRLLRSIFKSSKDQIWKRLCDEIGADFVDGGAWRGDRAQARVGEWTITLDTHLVAAGMSSATWTRIRAPFVNRDGFRFKIFPQDVRAQIGKHLGLQDIVIGEEKLDRRFIIQGNDPEHVRLMMAQASTRRLIGCRAGALLQVRDDEGVTGRAFPPGVDELLFQVLGRVEEIALLKQMYEDFAATLNTLCHIGSAYEDDPHFAL